MTSNATPEWTAERIQTLRRLIQSKRDVLKGGVAAGEATRLLEMIARAETELAQLERKNPSPRDLQA